MLSQTIVLEESIELLNNAINAKEDALNRDDINKNDCINAIEEYYYAYENLELKKVETIITTNPVITTKPIITITPL